MARAARRYDIYLPLTFNDGRSVPNERFVDVERRLIQQFGGVTSTPPQAPLRGIWQSATEMYVDQVTVIWVLDYRPRGSARFIADLKRDLLREFDQLEILITESALRVH